MWRNSWLFSRQVLEGIWKGHCRVVRAGGRLLRILPYSLDAR